ncbi:MAG: DUF3617 family protein [Gammaproteobacteria bacterium]|jgi:hypothetical protein
MNSSPTRHLPPLSAALLAGALLSGAFPPTSVQSAAPDELAPGQYEVTTTTTYTDVPVADSVVTTEHCLTREELNREPASVFAGLPDGKSCEIGEFVMSGGTIRIEVDCAAPDGDMTMITTGSYDAHGYQMVADVTITVGDDQVKTQSKIDARRLGDC